MLNTTFWKRLLTLHKGHKTSGNRCFWGVDIHSHLAPGLDDGVSDLEESLVCLRQLSDWGIQKIITTPHVSHDWFPNTTTAIKQGLIAIQDLIHEQQIPLTVDIAAEYMLDDFFPDKLNQGDLLAFEKERYLLIEAGWSTAPFGLADLLTKIQTYGYKPVLAHPERYAYYHNDTVTLSHVREIGCLFQLNWMSLCGRYGVHVEKQARYLLRQGWVDFIGSDLHRPSDLKTMNRLFSTSDMRLLKEQPLLNATL